MRRALPLLAIAALFGLVFLWLRPTLAPEFGPAALSEDGRPTASAPGDQLWALLGGQRPLWIRLVTTHGTPVAGLDTTMGEANGTSDAYGLVRLVTEDGPLELPDGWGVLDAPPGWDRVQLNTVIVGESCPGDLLVVRDGAPVPGAELRLPIPWANWNATTDASGRVAWPQKPCGELVLAVKTPDYDYPRVATTSQVGTTALPLQTIRSGELLVMDPDGEFVEVDLWTPAHTEILGLGSYRVSAPTKYVDVGLESMTLEHGPIEVTLDGRVTQVVMERKRVPDRIVRLQAQCDGEPCESVQCALRRCESLAEGRFACRCPGEATELTTYSIQLPAIPLPEGIEAFEAHFEPQSDMTSVHGIWTGGTPCMAQVIHWGIGSQTGRCGGGTFEVLEIPDGEWTLEINAPGASEMGSLRFTASGGILDLGEIEPDWGSLSGQIVGDFDFRTAVLFSGNYPSQLQPDGRFVVEGMPAGATVTLSLVSADQTQRSAYPHAKEGSEILWHLDP